MVKRSSVRWSTLPEHQHDCSVTPQKTMVTLRSRGTSGQYWVVRLTGSTRPIASGRTGHTQSHTPPTTAVGWATGSGRVSSHAGSRSLYKVGRHWGCLQMSTFIYSGFVLRAGTQIIYPDLFIYLPSYCRATKKGKNCIGIMYSQNTIVECLHHRNNFQDSH